MKLQHIRFFAVAAVAALCILNFETPAAAGRKNVKKSELAKENDSLRLTIDSLAAEIDRLNEEMRINDSINLEIIDIQRQKFMHKLSFRHIQNG